MGFQVDVDRSLDVFVRVILDPAVRARDADVVDENVKLPELDANVGYGAICVPRRRCVPDRAAKARYWGNRLVDWNLIVR